MKHPLIVLIGPSGVGKSSFLERALVDFSQLRDAITYTTRAMRQGESEGQPYHFVTRPKFEELIKQGFFIEFAEVHGNLYGTPVHQLEDAWKSNQVVVMDVDVQGARTFQAKYPEALTIFILPPTIDALRQRIIKREGKIPKDMELRLKNAEGEMAQAHLFSHQVVNDDFTAAYGQIKKLIEDFIGNR